MRLEEQCGRYRQAERCGGLEVHNQLEARWPFDEHLGWPGALQNAIDVSGSVACHLLQVRPIAHQGSHLGKFLVHGDDWQPTLRCQVHDAGAVMADDLKPAKARILLMLLLQGGVSGQADLQAAFNR